MSLSFPSLLASIGLLLDILGAWLLARGLFLENTSSIVDKGYLRDNRYYGDKDENRIAHYGVYRIIDRCNEIFFTRIGIYLLSLGFSLQILSNFFSSQLSATSNSAIPLAVYLILLLTFFFLIDALHYQLHLRKEAAKELICRILQYDQYAGFPPVSGLDGKKWSHIVTEIIFNEQLALKKISYLLNIKESSPLDWMQQQLNELDQSAEHRRLKRIKNCNLRSRSQ